MLGNLGQIAATVSLNIDPFQVSQRVLNSSIKATAAELRAQDAAFKGSEKSINFRNSENGMMKIRKRLKDLIKVRLHRRKKLIVRQNCKLMLHHSIIELLPLLLKMKIEWRPYAKRLHCKVTAGLKYQTAPLNLHLLPKRQAPN